MANTQVHFDKITWKPGSGDTSLTFCGSSHNANLTKGEDNAAQIIKYGMGSSLYFGDNSKINFSIKVGSAAAYLTAAHAPQVTIDRQGRIKLTGSGNINSAAFSSSMFLSGTPDGNSFYVVLDLTNNSGSSQNVTPALQLKQQNLMNFRQVDVGNADSDAYSWDATNVFMQLTSPAISNIYVGIKACYTTQQYRVSNTSEDINTSYLNSGDLPNTIATTGAENYCSIQYGSTASPITIANGATQRFVWVVAFKTTLVALQTLMAGLTATPTTDITAADGYHTTSKMSVQFPEEVWGSLLYDLNISRLNVQSHSQKISNRQIMPAGSYTFTYPFARDGYYSTKAILQMGGQSIVSDEYQLFKSNQNGNNSQQHEVPQYVNASGQYITSGTNGSPGDQDAYQILKAYEYYVATQDGTFLGNEITTLNNIGTYLQNYYNATTKYNGLFPAAGAATYPDGEGNITGTSPIHDPVMMSLYIYAFQRLAELNTVAGNTSQASTWTSFATTLQNAFSTFWNSSANWLYFNIKTDGTTYPNKHITKVDAGLWGVLATTNCQAMATDLLMSAWWNSSQVSFNEMPTTDALYASGNYWYGRGWNMTDFKAIEFILRYGTASQAQTAWRYFKLIARNRLDTLRGFMAEHMDTSGVFGFSIGAMTEMIVRGLFGIDTHATYFTINPNCYKLDIGGQFRLTNLKMGNQLYTITISGVGSTPVVSVNGVVQGSNQINYGGNTNISVVFSGRQQAS